MGGKLTFPGRRRLPRLEVRGRGALRRAAVRGRGLRVKVVIVEPGLIVTRFGETAAGSIAGTETPKASAEDPYAEFNATVGSATAAIYDGPMRHLGGGPDAVAKVIERAITSRNPRPRYKVTASARLAMAQRALAPDRVWDAAMRVQFKPPGA